MSTAFDRERPAIMGDVIVPLESEDSNDSRYVKVVTAQTILRALRRRRLWVVTALLGMILGAGLHSVIPAKYSATTKLYLAEPAGSSPSQAMANDTTLLGTQAVASRAMQLLHVGGDVSSFVSSYEGVALSDAVVAVTSSASSAQAAKSRVNAIARAFLDVRSSEFSAQTAITLSGLQDQIRSLNQDIGKLTSEISSESTAATAAANTVTDLVNERTSDESQVAQLSSQAQQDEINRTALVDGSRVIDPGFVSGKSQKKVILTDGLSGLVGGLGLGVIVIIVGMLLSEGVRSRELISSLVGAPVELSVGRVAQFRWFRTYRMRRLLSRPPSPLRMIERRLVQNLGCTSSGRLVVVELGATDIAALAIARAATAIAAEGRHVILVDSAEGRPLCRLVGRSSKLTGRSPSGQYITVEGHQVTLYSVPEDPGERQIPVDDDATVLVLVTPDPALGCSHLEGIADRGVAIVRSGRVEPGRLQSTQEMLSHSGISVGSALVVDADPDDQTVGFAGSVRDEHTPPVAGFGLLRARLVGQ